MADAYQASRAPGLKTPLNPLPHNFHRALEGSQFYPSLYQLLTLSRLTRYRLVDWLAVFGFHLDEIIRLQTLFPPARTVELDSQAYEGTRGEPWFEELRPPDFSAPLTPLTRWLGLRSRRAFHPTGAHPASSHRFVRIGVQDSFAFPDLLPGSIVRIRSRPENKGPLATNESRSGLFLVEHSQGLVCTRLGRSSSGKLVLCSRQMPYAPVELQQGTEVIVLGKADLELRVLDGAETPLVPPRLGRFWTPRPLRIAPLQNVGEFIRKARLRSGLTFRDASRRTRQIARRLENSRYYCAPGTLSDFETRKLLPRQIHKIISICAIYFANPTRLLEVAGVPLEVAGHRSIPEEFLPRAPRANIPLKRSPFFKAVERRFGTAPYFLSQSLAGLFRLPGVSPRDIFWAGGLPLKSGLDGALFLALDRRQKVPRPSLSAPASQQPLYVVLLRDGTYLCGFCALQNGVLILRPCEKGQPRFLRLRNRVEAEVIGRVIAVLRKLR